MLNFNSILLSSENPDKLIAFYKQVFEKEPDMEGSGYAGFSVGSAFITIGPHDKVKGKSTNPERILINLETSGIENEFDRISKIEGVVIIKEIYEMEGMQIATLADPDGNYFQLMTPWEDNTSN